MGFGSHSLYPSAALLGCLPRQQLNEVAGMDDLTVELLCMLLQHLESLWVGLLGNHDRAMRSHDAGLGFSNRLNAATFAKQQWLLMIKTCLKNNGLHLMTRAL